EAKEKEQLQERITLVGALANAYPVIIQVNLTNEKLSFIYVQPGLMLDLGRQKVYSELYEDMAATVHPDYVTKFRLHFAPENLYATLGHRKNEVFIEAKQILADGRYHWISTQIIYVDNPYSGDELAILISRRSDEQRYEEEQRRQALQSALDNANAANRGKSQFLSNMSHDIRTPINAIAGMTSIAAAHLDDTRRVEECLKKIALSSRHLLGLINDVLDMSKIESGKLTLREESFNFAELVTETAELIRPQAYGKQLQTDVCLTALKNENVTGDPLRLQQVCLNILSNAVKYTPSGGRISIEVSQEDSAGFGYQCYVFRCADTGIGMEEEFLKVIFQPFERAKDSTSSKIAGTGLGMAITKNLVDLMNGEIQVESRPGIGSVFTVRIPLKVQDAPEEKVPAHWMGIRTLIVDGDICSRESTARLLADMGLPAEAVGEGEEAVSFIMEARDSGNPCGLVFINCSSGDGQGAEAVRLIRKKCGPKGPALVLAAGEWAEIQYEGKETDAAAFLSLPFYRSKVYHLLKELDSGKRLPEQQEERVPDYSGKRLLLAEDNELNREIAVELIGSTGVQIEEACDGEEAVKKVEASEEGYYDMIIMDIKMPNMDGYEATRVIRNMNRRDVRTIPIVAMTANAFEEDVRMALHMGMNAHVSKPIDTEVLNQLLDQYLSDSGA
ncbi:hybrid sensor histidine kinase/response regulator, partial [Lactonifactor longoviformis]